LYDKFGKDVVHSMIEYNLMYLRPTCSLSYDVCYHENAIVMVESQAAKVAMEKLLTN